MVDRDRTGLPARPRGANPSAKHDRRRPRRAVKRGRRPRRRGVTVAVMKVVEVVEVVEAEAGEGSPSASSNRARVFGPAGEVNRSGFFCASERVSDRPTLTFCGAAGTVTGSRHLVACGG